LGPAVLSVVSFVDERGSVMRLSEVLLRSEGWELFLQAKSSLGRKLLPYLARIRRDLASSDSVAYESAKLTGNDVYDGYLSVYAILAVWVVASINSGHAWWLEDEGLVEKLKEIDCVFDANMAARKERLERSQVCAEVIAKMETAVRECPCLEEWARYFVPARAPWPRFAQVARLIDRSEIQMLRDVFYVVTGMETFSDATRGHGSLERRLCCEVGPPEMEWRTVCPVDTCGDVEGNGCGQIHGTAPGGRWSRRWQ